MDIKSINKDTVIDALVNRCDTLHKINLEQRSKLIKQDNMIKELVEFINELYNDKIFKSNMSKQD